MNSFEYLVHRAETTFTRSDATWRVVVSGLNETSRRVKLEVRVGNYVAVQVLPWYVFSLREDITKNHVDRAIDDLSRRVAKRDYPSR